MEKNEKKIWHCKKFIIVDNYQILSIMGETECNTCEQWPACAAKMGLSWGTLSSTVVLMPETPGNGKSLVYHRMWDVAMNKDEVEKAAATYTDEHMWI